MSDAGSDGSGFNSENEEVKELGDLEFASFLK